MHPMSEVTYRFYLASTVFWAKIALGTSLYVISRGLCSEDGYSSALFLRFQLQKMHIDRHAGVYRFQQKDFVGGFLER
jgi:hypothetical protein